MQICIYTISMFKMVAMMIGDNAMICGRCQGRWAMLCGISRIWTGATTARSGLGEKSLWKVETEQMVPSYSDPLMARLIKKAGTSMVALGDIGDSLGNRVRPRCQGLDPQITL